MPAYLEYQIWRADRDYAEAVAETDALDPGWRFEDILAGRPAIAGENNSALQLIAARKALTENVWLGEKAESLIGQPAPNVVISVPAADALRNYFNTEKRAREEAHKLKDMPDGRHPLTYKVDWTNYPLDWLQHLRMMAHFLQLDTMLRAHEGEPGEIGGACRAQINAARSVGDEPSLIALLVRIACLEIAIGSLERALAQSELPPVELQSIQDLLQREIDEPRLLWAMRGERAGGMQMIEAIYAGKAKRPVLVAGKSGWRDTVREWLHIGTPLDRAGYLRGMNQMVEAAKLPVERQKDEVARVSDECERRDGLLAMLMPACNKVTDAHTRNQARLRCALVALAVERFRHERQVWPPSLDMLVETGFLKSVPIDPFDGKPLRYRPTADGVVVYSVGYDKIDNGGMVDYTGGLSAMSPGTDVGFRLWTVEKRRRPAPQPKAIDAP